MPCDPLEIVTDSAAVICQSKPCIDAQPVPIVALLDELINQFDGHCPTSFNHASNRASSFCANVMNDVLHLEHNS